MRIKLPIEIFQIDKQGYHIFVEAEINDENVSLIIDTGASSSVFDMNLLQTKLKAMKAPKGAEFMSSGISDAKIDTHFAEIETLKIADFVLYNYKTVLLDLSHINNLYSNFGNRTIWGLIGGDFLKKYKAVINYQNKTLTLSSPRMKKK